MFVDAIDVHRAIEREELVPFFQPQVEVRTGKLTGFEILARWQHPQRGPILPGNFISLAEEQGLIGRLMQQILRKAFQSFPVLPEPLMISVNVSPIQLQDLNLPRQIQHAAENSGFPATRLTIEVTESALVNNLERAQQIASELKAMGCELALDDFGTGYSSLNHLQALPFDELKVDASFIESMTTSRESRKIVAAVVGLGHSLGLATVAEGVETAEQADMLLRLSCEFGQGWLYGRPMPAEEIPAFVASGPQAATSASSDDNPAVSSLEALPAQRLAQLQAIYDGSPAGLCFLDRHLRYVSINRRLADMHGVPVAEHLGRTPQEVIPDAYPVYEPYLLRALQGEALPEVEVSSSAIKPGEKDRTALLSYQPAFDEAGEIIGVSVAVADITERKRAEQALRESEDHYRHMVELNPQSPWITDAEGNNLEASHRWVQATGLSKEQTRNWGWVDALHAEDLDHAVKTIIDSLQTGKPIDVEYRVRTPEGNWKWMRSRGSPRFAPSGEILAWYGSVEDIDDRKHMEEDLRKSQAQLRAVFDAAPVGIVIADAPDGTLTMANPEAKRIFRDAILPGQKLSSYREWGAMRADGSQLNSSDYPLARAILRGEITHAEELLVRLGDGTGTWIAVSTAPVRGAAGEITGAVAVIQDIDQAKRESQRLQQLTDELQRLLKQKSGSE
jgi:PAS domain S-box-containing protein